MKIWIDITNSPHVNFFAEMIRELENEHELLLTCRPLANTIEMLDLLEFSYHIIGKHYGQHSIRKATGFFIRIMQLYFFLKRRKIDVAISHSSFYSPVVAKMLGVRSIYLNDNEHAYGNRISFRFADRIMIPEFLAGEKVKRQGASPDKIIHYPGVKEGIYLWNYKKIRKHEDIDRKKRIYIRPEPWTAQYYKGKKNFIDALLTELKKDMKIILLPRGTEQKEYYQQERFNGIKVLEKSIDLVDILNNCDLFIGAGGTMTREAAVLGVPTISIYQEKLLDVDKYLIKEGYMSHSLEPTIEIINEKLKEKKCDPDSNLMSKGKRSYYLIVNELMNIANKKR